MGYLINIFLIIFYIKKTITFKIILSQGLRPAPVAIREYSEYRDLASRKQRPKQGKKYLRVRRSKNEILMKFRGFIERDMQDQCENKMS